MSMSATDPDRRDWAARLAEYVRAVVDDAPDLSDLSDEQRDRIAAALLRGGQSA